MRKVLLITLLAALLAVPYLASETTATAKEKGGATLTEILENQSRLGGAGSGKETAYNRDTSDILNGTIPLGREGGPVSSKSRVYGRDTYNMRFIGGANATIRLQGDGDDIELYVYDENNNLITKDAGGSNTNRNVSFRPKWTGSFRIVIVNPSSSVSYVDYTITTN